MNRVCRRSVVPTLGSSGTHFTKDRKFCSTSFVPLDHWSEWKPELTLVWRPPSSQSDRQKSGHAGWTGWKGLTLVETTTHTPDRCVPRNGRGRERFEKGSDRPWETRDKDRSRGTLSVSVVYLGFWTSFYCGSSLRYKGPRVWGHNLHLLSRTK